MQALCFEDRVVVGLSQRRPAHRQALSFVTLLPPRVPFFCASALSRWRYLQAGLLSYYADASSRVLRKQLRVEGSTLRLSVYKPVIRKAQYHLRLSNPKWDRPLQAYVPLVSTRAHTHTHTHQLSPCLQPRMHCVLGVCLWFGE
jgi:hypothetical protein